LTEWREEWDVGAKTAIATVAASAPAAISARRAVTRPQAGDVVLVIGLVVVGRVVRQDTATAPWPAAALPQQDRREQKSGAYTYARLNEIGFHGSIVIPSSARRLHQAPDRLAGPRQGRPLPLPATRRLSH